MELRWYQRAAIDSLYQYFRSANGNPVLALPTGTGKSVIQAKFTQEVLTTWPSQRIVVATHVKELIEQNHAKLVQAWPQAPAGIFSASVGRKEVEPITFAGIQSVAKKAYLFGKVDLLIIDECHLVGNDQNSNYLQFIKGLKEINPALRAIGMTATPYRLGMGMITDGGIFTDIAYDLTDRQAFLRMVAEGWIVPLISRKTNVELDVTDVHKSGGEFIAAELQAAVDKAPITGAALKEALAVGGNRKHWLVFAAGLTHASHIYEILQQMGIPSAIVSGDMPKDARERALRAFRSGEIRAVINNNVLTTGFDFPGIDLIVMLRPTASPGLWVQMLGRGMRPCDGKTNCLVLDFAGNTRRLGPVNDPVIPRKKGDRTEGGTAPVRLCQECNTYNHASARVCECCGYEFPRAIKIETVSSLQSIIADEPIIIEFPVTEIEYRIHNKAGRPPSMQVVYYSGMLQRFKEWVCFEHGGYPTHKARQWWHERTAAPTPSTTAEAVAMAMSLPRPTAIKVWTNTKHPEVMSHVFN